jgi:hypothetical protein
MWIRSAVFAALLLFAAPQSATSPPAQARFVGHTTPIPAPAVAAGQTRLVFSSRFLPSEIDLANSGSAGFKWYIRRAWPQVGGPSSANWQQDGWAAFDTNPNTAANYSFNLNGSANVSTTNSISLASAAYNGAGGYVGQVFGGGGYFEVTGSYSVTPSPPGFGQLAIMWHHSINWLLGQTADFIEVDTQEHGNLGPGTNFSTHSGSVHWHTDQFTAPSGHPTGDWISLGCDCTNNSPDMDGKLHTWAWRWKTKAQNGGTGELTFYQDGVLQSTKVAPDVMDTQSYIIYINGTVTVHSIRVFQQ